MIFWTNLQIENYKSEHHHRILHIRISLGTKLQLKLIISSFWTKFAQKRYFHSKTGKVNITIEFCIFDLVYVPSFSLKLVSASFKASFAKWLSARLWTKWLWVLVQLQSLKVIILTFWTKLAQRGYFWFKTEKVNSIVLFILKLVLVTNFSLNWQFGFSDQICEKGVSPVKSGKIKNRYSILHIRITLSALNK